MVAITDTYNLITFFLNVKVKALIKKKKRTYTSISVPKKKIMVTQRLDGLANVSFKHFIKQLNCKALHLCIKCKALHFITNV